MTWPYWLVLLAVLAANARYLTGYSVSDPRALRSGLASSLVKGRLPGSYTIDPNDGTTSQALGKAAWNQLLHGHLPLWNAFEGFGAPLAGGMQSAALFPLIFLQGLPAGFLLFHVVLQLIGGFGAARLMQVMELRAPACAIAGVLFALTGSVVWLANAPAVPVAFLPMLLIGLERTARNVSTARWRGVATTAVAVWCLITAGFPEGLYLSALFAGLWFLWRLLRCEGFRIRFVARLAVGVGLGVLLAAPLLAAFLSYLHTHPYVGGHSGDGFSTQGRPEFSWGAMFAPYAFGPIFGFSRVVGGTNYLAGFWGGGGGYFSAALLFLAFVGLLGYPSRRYRALRLICAGWSLLCAAKTFAWPVVTPLVNHVPGMKPLVFYRYCFPTWAMAMIVLAVLAVDGLDRREIRWWQTVAAGIATVATMAACLRQARELVGRYAGQTPQILTYYHASYIWALVSIILLFGAALIARRFRRFALAVMVLVLVGEATVMFALPSASAPRRWTQDTALVDWLHDLSDKGKDGSDLGRVYSLSTILQANYASYYGVGSINVNDNPEPQGWVDFVRERAYPGITNGRITKAPQARLTALVANVDAYRQAGVEYILAPRGLAITSAAAPLLTAVTSTAISDIYRLNGASDYATAPGCTVTPHSRTSFDVDCAAAATLTRREQIFPGWRASVGGEDVPVVAADTYFQGVPVPAGHSVVTFTYRPRWLLPTLVLAAAGLVALVVLLAAALGLRSRRREDPRHTGDAGPRAGASVVGVSSGR
ncbi:MAG: hypothetical protein JWN95_3211 [Frankiales bacterium]|nr:hypothetical protein [Frankiales bacterium]